MSQNQIQSLKLKQRLGCSQLACIASRGYITYTSLLNGE